MAKRGEYRLTLSADGRLLRQEVQKSSADLKKFEGSVQQVSSELGKLGASVQQDLSGPLGKLGPVLGAIGPVGLAAAAGIGAVIAAAGTLVGVIANATKEAVAYGGQITDMAAKNQMGAEAFQALSQGMALAGLSMEQLQKATTEMQKELVNSPATFKSLGLEAAKLRAMDPAEAFLKTARAIATIEDPALRTAAALEVFGRGGPAVVAAADQLGEAAERARELGNVMSVEVIAGLDKTGDAAQTLGTTWEHLFLNIGAAIATAPGVAEAIDSMADALGGLSQMVLENQDDIQALISDVFPAVAGAVVLVVNGIKTLIGVLGQLREAWNIRVPDWVKVATGMTGVGVVKDFLKDASGVQSRPAFVGPPKPRAGGGDFDTQGERAAADRAAKAAERARDAWQRAAEQARAAWDKFYLSFELGTKKAAGNIQDELAARAKEAADAQAINFVNTMVARAEEAENVGPALFEMAQQVADAYVEAQEKQDKLFDSMTANIDHTADGFRGLGAVIGGTMGQVLDFVGQTVRGLNDIRVNMKDFKTAGGGFGGMLGKLGAGLGMAGAAIGIGKQIFGGIKSLFGGKSKEQKDAEEQERRQTKDKALSDLAAIEERIKKFRMDSLNSAVGGTAALFTNLANSADVSQERLDRLGRLGAATFAQLKKEGLSTVEAVKAMGPALDAAIAATSKAGLELPAALAEFAAFRQLVTENQDLVNAAEGVGQIITGLKATGGLTQTAMNDAMAEVGDLFGQLQAAGFTSQQALAALAPSLFAIQQAAKDGKVAIDSETQALVDQAQAAGLFEGMKDPMAEMVEIQKLMLETTAALAKVFGAVLPAEVQKYIDKLHQVPGIPVPGAPGGDASSAPAGPAEGMDTTTAATGMSQRKLTRDTMILAHRGEIHSVGKPGVDVGAGGGAAQVTVAPVINMPIDPLAVDRNFEKFLERIAFETAAAIRAGTSPVLRALQDRGKV